LSQHLLSIYSLFASFIQVVIQRGIGIQNVNRMLPM